MKDQEKINSPNIKQINIFLEYEPPHDGYDSRFKYLIALCTEKIYQNKFEEFIIQEIKDSSIPLDKIINIFIVEGKVSNFKLKKVEKYILTPENLDPSPPVERLKNE